MLQPIQSDSTEIAKAAARQVLVQINQVATNIVKLRRDGIPAIPSREASTTPDGRVIPAFDGRPVVTGAEIDAALGEANVAVLTTLAAALGL
jgi:hypothetical protein